jgi:hypothetical protein
MIKAPPSTPALKVSGVPVKALVLGTNVSSTATSANDGSFTITNLPAGNVEITATATSGKLTFTADGALFFDRNYSANVVLLGTKDVLNGVAPIVVTGSSSPRNSTTLRDDDLSGERAAAAASSTFRPLRPRVQTNAGPSVSIDALAAAQNARIADQKQLTVPKGTKQLVLRYTVSTAEYPYYVLKQSIYNDVWDLKVINSSGASLYSISRNVNSQVALAPTWGGSGSTGEIKAIFDISLQTTAGPATFIIAGSATNIGDSQLATHVSATLGTDVPLAISFVKLTNATDGPDDIISIPRLNQRNTFERRVMLRINAPASATVSNIARVQVQIGLGASATMGPVVFDGKPKQIDSKTFTVPATFTGDNPNKSPVNSIPPPSHNVQYFVTAFAKVDGKDVQDQAHTGLLVGLWKMPNGLARFGARDIGGDEWSSKGTYNWLDTNRSLVTRVNDISGEHGRNIGHVTHRRGTDIDIFHFNTLDATSGLANYLKLEDNATLAAGTGQAADQPKAVVAGWLTAQRAGLTNLANQTAVDQLFTGVGAKSGILPGGWLRKLMQTGRFTTTTNQLVVIDNGASLSGKIHYNNVHNDHNHITLNQSVLGTNIVARLAR